MLGLAGSWQSAVLRRVTVCVRLPDLPQHLDGQGQGALVALERESLVDPGLAEIAVHDVALNISRDHAVRRTQCSELTMSISDIGPMLLTCMLTSIKVVGPPKFGLSVLS